MQRLDPNLNVDDALSRLEATVIPTVSMVLDALLDAARLASTGSNAVCAAELRAIAAQLELLNQQVEALAPPQAPIEWPLRMSA